ncbi:ricin-type beta-trefoil lectin domain protein [Streptomyces sp. SDr-06]|uniref:ricin-type beta-trefoil lectin domain protein n=1 Tax=Streptomyces sp. SDr-06 TaxID=2267702 RepID=UPI001CB92B61|nr:ricin-type beta-trefoil lectin domain protein [Streptomyces sp. SDr-06]
MRSVKKIRLLTVLAALTAVTSIGLSGEASSHTRADGTMRNAGNGFCLDIKTYNVGEPVILWPCHGGTSQQWQR